MSTQGSEVIVFGQLNVLTGNMNYKDRWNERSRMTIQSEVYREWERNELHVVPPFLKAGFMKNIMNKKVIKIFSFINIHKYWQDQ